MQNLDYIFRGATAKNKNFYGSKFSKLKKELALNQEYNLYTVRHTGATNLLNATGDIEFVSKQLGHSNIEMTATHYINRQDSHYKKIMESVKGDDFA